MSWGVMSEGGARLARGSETAIGAPCPGSLDTAASSLRICVCASVRDGAA